MYVSCFFIVYVTFAIPSSPILTSSGEMGSPGSSISYDKLDLIKTEWKSGLKPRIPLSNTWSAISCAFSLIVDISLPNPALSTPTITQAYSAEPWAQLNWFVTIIETILGSNTSDSNSLGSLISSLSVLANVIDILFLDFTWSIISWICSWNGTFPGSNHPKVLITLSDSFNNSTSNENASVIKKEEQAKSVRNIKNNKIIWFFIY